MVSDSRNIIRSLVSIFIAVVLSEIFLHLVCPEVAYQNMPQRVIKDFTDKSSIVEYTLKKNYSGRFLMTAAEFDSLVQTNSLGWRDTEPDAREKILVFGDSYTFGYGLSNGKTIPDELEKIVGRKIDFVNLGLTAGGSPDSYAVYLRHHRNLQGKRIIVLISTTDFRDVTTNDCLDSIGEIVSIKTDSCIKIRGRTSFVKDGELFTSRNVTSRMPAWMRSWFKQSYLIALIRDRMQADEKSPANSLPEMVVNKIDPEALKKFSDSMDVLKTLSKEMVVFTLGREAGEEESAFNRAVGEYCQTTKLICGYVPKFSDDHYWKRDAHYNEAGAARVAQFILDKLPRSYIK